MKSFSTLTCLFSLFCACMVSSSLLAEEEPVRQAKNALEGLDVAEGLDATLFVSEPEMLSPTNIDIDARGRVWVCEVVNYRRRDGERPEGDRILIFEDTDGDGKADSKKVFYQGRDIDTAMGICVMGNRVIVSVAPYVFVLIDDDGDDKADRKETLFSNTGQPQHDHSNHAFIFGPDGKLYWNFGNTGKHVHDADGNPVISKEGHAVVDNGQPYIGGMVFRCNMDGSEFEVLGHNFRNNYEVTVDSFGTLWQSDNDDDGNQGVRINYVMEHGNFGYRDEMTGAGWRDPRIGMAEEIPLRHWHLNDPGVVPNLLQTGGGSPTGICLYEGNLLSEVFQNEMIHTDAGPNIVRAYPVEKEGAGYSAKMVNILEGTRDKWFRPSDVCVAPDGSLIVADWYDPGVGGHRMGDVEKGRLFRIAPKGTPYHVTKFDVSTPEGAIEALKSPNLARRYLAWTALHEMQEKAETALVKLSQDSNPRYQARAFWLLGKIKNREEQTIREMLKQDNSDLRVQALRVARQTGADLRALIEKLADDPSPQVRRECALSLRDLKPEEIPPLWTKLALQYDGQDRWYLEALGIGAANNWDVCLADWLKEVSDDWSSSVNRDIVWRSRGKQTPSLLLKLLIEDGVPEKTVPRYLRAFDFLPEADKTGPLMELALNSNPEDHSARTNLIVQEALLRLPSYEAIKQAHKEDAFATALDRFQGKPAFVELVTRYSLEDRYPELIDIAMVDPQSNLSVEAILTLLNAKQFELIRTRLDSLKPEEAEKLIQVIGYSQQGGSVAVFKNYIQDEEQDISLRRLATLQLGKSKYGSEQLLKWVEEKQLPKNLKNSAEAALLGSADQKIREASLKLFPQAPSRNNKPLPPIQELAKRTGSVAKGRLVFNGVGTCIKCHQVAEFGKDFGPALTEIGSKLSREAMYEAILFPSAGISHNYEAYTLVDVDGNVLSGLLTSQTNEAVTLKTAEGISRTIKQDDIDELIKQNISLMPADLQKIMSEEELVDLVEYMSTLKKTE
ncbi:MAG: c-type cytochrome [Planctomycetaceae bacterium]|nr:c-type cytochrome [Planctomycetaceae bacterium]